MILLYAGMSGSRPDVRKGEETRMKLLMLSFLHHAYRAGGDNEKPQVI